MGLKLPADTLIVELWNLFMFVYFIRSGRTGPIKIGVSGDIEKRLETLQIGNQFKLSVVGMIPCKDRDQALELEGRLHKLFKRKHIRGEWFMGDINFKHVYGFKSLAEKPPEAPKEPPGETLTHGFDGMESPFEQAILNRGVTLDQHNTKMANLSSLAREGFRVIRAIRHDKYSVEGKDQFYNPYRNTWYST